MTIRKRHLSRALLVAVVCTACVGNKSFDSYQHLSGEEWNRQNILTYNIPTVHAHDVYKTNVGVRFNDDYSYRNLALEVRQTIHRRDTLSRDTIIEYIDTIHFSVYDNKGKLQGAGLFSRQLNSDVRIFSMNEGDSLVVSLRHIMHDAVLYGIEDAGVNLIGRKPRYQRQ